MSDCHITSRQVGFFVLIALGLLFAFWAGNLVADENYLPLILTIGGLLAGWIYFGQGSSIYLLIPICWNLTGQIEALPLPFNIRELVIMLASAVFIAEFIFKRNRIKARYEMIDLWIWINILYLITVFFRNPVGINALGGDRVGGKPYLDVALACAAYLMLSRFRITPRVSRKLPFFILGIVFFGAFAGGVATYLPDLGDKLGRLYSDFNPALLGLTPDSEVVAGETRLIFLQNLGTTLVLIIVSGINPFQLLSPSNFGFLLSYLSGYILILFSGFRNAIVGSLLYTVVSAGLRERGLGLLKMAILGVMGVVLVIGVSYSPLQIPLTFQRALSFLPGNWDSNAVADAKGSSEWRFEMWKIVLTSDRYIHNKLYGDGFGFLRSDFEIMQNLNAGIGQGFGGDNAQQEAFMINGDFHSGPVSTIRFVGYVGLALFLPLLFMTAFYAYRIMRETYGGPFQFYAFFLGIPIVLLPLTYIFIFGDYRSDFSGILFNVGLLKMLSGSLSELKERS